MSEATALAVARERCVWPVLWNSLFWTAGNSLTSGGFLAYFAVELGARGSTLAVLLILPELLGVCGLSARRWILVWGPKRVFIGSSLLAFIPLALVPLLAFPALRPADSDLAWLIAALALHSLLRGVTFVALICWLTRVVPAAQWGRFLAWRQSVQLAVLLVIPVGAGFARDWWKLHWPADRVLWAYAISFVVGVGFLALSVLVVWHVPEAEVDGQTNPVPATKQNLPAASGYWRLWRDPNCRGLILFSWTHALASGLTQAAFFQYRIGPLGIGLGTFYLLEGGMRLAQIPVSGWSGRGGDVRRHKPFLICGAVVTALSLIFWMLATRDHWWWLWGAYLLWGGWGAVNVSGPAVLLRVTPRRDHALALAMFQNVAGFLAGLSGLAGGLLLDLLLDWQRHQPGTDWSVWQILFGASLCGRLAAVLWLIRVHEERAHE